VDELSASAICKALRSDFFGQQVVYCPTIDSTNSVAKMLALQGAAEGTLVVADKQTAGRGRLGRRWLAPRGTCLLFSLVFRPGLKVERAQALNMICGLGVRQAIHELTALPAQLKWPNDIMLHGRKAGGILTEMSSRGELLEYVVVGIGLNVNVDITALPAEFNATSIAHELGRMVPRLSLLQEAVRLIEQRYSALRAGESPLADWAAALETLGQRVQVHTGQGLWQGLATGVDDEGALLLRLDDGHLRRVLLGDIVAYEEK